MAKTDKEKLRECRLLLRKVEATRDGLRTEQAKPVRDMLALVAADLQKALDA